MSNKPIQIEALIYEIACLACLTTSCFFLWRGRGADFVIFLALYIIFRWMVKKERGD